MPRKRGSSDSWRRTRRTWNTPVCSRSTGSVREWWGADPALRDSAVVAVNARTLPLPSGFDTAPVLGAAAAQQAARALLTKHTGAVAPLLSKPRLEIFNRGMLDGRKRPTRLAWVIEAAAPGRRELIWIDARNGGVLLHFNQQPEALLRAVHSADHGPSLPEGSCAAKESLHR